MTDKERSAACRRCRSVVEFLRLIGPLTSPHEHGGNREDAFHLVIPSLPGFGFSGPTHDKGWGTLRTGKAWAALMRSRSFGPRTSRPAGAGRPGRHDQTRSNRSRFITLSHATTESCTHFSFASSLAYTSASPR